MKPNNRILHFDADSFFASCEIALNPKLQGRAVWVGGGRRGDGIVIAANRAAKKFGIKSEIKMSLCAATRDGEKTLGNGRRPARAQRRLGKAARQNQQTAPVHE